MYQIITDSSSNLFSEYQDGTLISVIPMLIVDDHGQEIPASSSDMDRLSRGIYARMRDKEMLRTSMINTRQFEDAFEPFLNDGKDVLYVGMSGGISGTCAAAESAADELKAKYPDRKVLVADTLSAAMGEGMLVRRACEYQREGLSIEENHERLLCERMKMCQLFTVDDLSYLSRGGRLSNIGALIGSIGHIKPILYGNDAGKIVSLFKLVGRKKAIQAIAELYAVTAADPVHGKLCITHGDCEDDAAYLADRLRRLFPEMDTPECVIHEPGTAVHVGPGMLSMFYFGKDDSFRKKKSLFQYDIKGWLQSKIAR